MAKVEGAPERLLFVEDGGWADDVDGSVWNPDCITDARPLIVLDLDGYLPAELNALLRDEGYTTLADQIEAQSKPARIPEPGLWGVVEASYAGWSRCPFVHGDDGLWRVQTRRLESATVAWDHLADPTLIREGVES
jgi:hypothetical protein